MKVNQKLGNKGFSLIELMVVVAIIGILASVAVPNMQKMMSKARQSEIKGQLGNLYSAEQNHHGEWSFYTGALWDVGYSPEGEIRYLVGFTAAGAPAALPVSYIANPVGCANTGVGACRPRATVHPAAAAVAFAVSPVNGACQAGAVPNGLFGQNATFVASGIGQIGGAGNDQWSINNLRSLCNNLSGISN